MRAFCRRKFPPSPSKIWPGCEASRVIPTGFLSISPVTLKAKLFLPVWPAVVLPMRTASRTWRFVAALAAVVADDDQGRLVEGHLNLAGAGREARALGGGAQVFILLGDAGGERRAFGGGRIGIDELYGAAGKDRGGEFDAEEGAADRGLVGGREFEIDFGGTGAGVFHDFGGGHRPADALGVTELAGGAHADGDGFGFAVAGVVVLLLLAAGATHRRRLGLGDAHAGTEFQEVALDAQAGQVTPSHDLRLSERYGCESRKEDKGANSPNHHHDSNARMAAIRPQEIGRAS